MLGPRIAALRRKAGLSQAELAARLGVSPSAMGMYEQNRREPSVQLLVSLAREFDVSTDFLLTGRAATRTETSALTATILDRVTTADRRLDNRASRPFSREELAVLMAALLIDP